MVDFADIDNSPAFLAHVKRELLHLELRIREQPSKRIGPSKVDRSLNSLLKHIDNECEVLQQRRVPDSELNLYEHLRDTIERSNPPHLIHLRDPVRDLLVLAVHSLCAEHELEVNDSRSGDAVELVKLMLDHLQLPYDPRKIVRSVVERYAT